MYIAIAGNIGSGKTTLTKMLSKHYGWKHHKLIIELAGRDNSVVKLMPPLVIDKETLIEGLKALKAAFEDCLKELN